MPEIPPRDPGIDRIQTEAVVTFIDWLYEDGPDPNTVTREKLYILWRARDGTKAMTEGVIRYVPVDGHDWRGGPQPTTHEDIERWQKSGELHRAAGLPVPDDGYSKSPGNA